MGRRLKVGGGGVYLRLFLPRPPRLYPRPSLGLRYCRGGVGSGWASTGIQFLSVPLKPVPSPLGMYSPLGICAYGQNINRKG